MKLICQNKRAYHDYTVLEKIQAGIALTGTEVKSCRGGTMSLAQSYVHFEPRAAKLVNANIATYAMGSYNNHVPTRQRQLLLHKVEIRRLKRAVEAKGLTVIPLQAYFDDKGHVKLDLGLCRGKNVVDKREDMKKKMDELDMKRSLKR